MSRPPFDCPSSFPMRQWLHNPWIVAGLVAAALILGTRSYFSDAGALVPAPGGTDAALAAPESALALAPVPAELVRAPALPRDPFAARPRPSSAPDLQESVHLSALWTENGSTLALINGQIVSPGQSFGGVRLESASEDGVWLSHAKGRDFLAVGQTFTLRTPARAAAVPGAL